MTTLRCPHEFRQTGDDTLADYCTYIQVPSLLSAYSPFLQSTDDKLFASALFAAALWKDIQERELTTLFQLTCSPCSVERYQEIMKRLQRCLAIAALLLQQGTLTRTHLIRRPKNKLGFQVEYHLADWHFWTPVEKLIEQLEHTHCSLQFQDQHLDVPAQEELLGRLQGNLLALHEQMDKVRQLHQELLEYVTIRSAPCKLPWRDLVPEEMLVSLHKQTMQRHHPQCLDDTYTNNDERTFIISHQASEVWFVAVIAAMEEAIALLQGPEASIFEAIALIRRTTDIICLLSSIIQMPQTIGAADYLLFRPQLETGSGAESIQFRILELRGGLRDERYRTALEHMHLMTPKLRQIWDAPSLNSVFLGIAASRGIINLQDSVEETAHRLTAMMLPVGRPNPHADLLELSEVLLDFEQQLDLWREIHIEMVDRMIGHQRPSIGMGGKKAQQSENDSKAYLLKTRTYKRMFSVLWMARNNLQEGIRSALAV